MLPIVNIYNAHLLAESARTIAEIAAEYGIKTPALDTLFVECLDTITENGEDYVPGIPF